MGETCLPDELRTLFLFEKLTDRQLKSLCDHGHLARFEPGPICIEGEAATCFYVLIEGELVMSKRSGGADIETNRTSQRGVYCGAWSAYVDGVPQVYESSVRVTKPSKFFVLDAAAFGNFVKTELPMAVHLLEGLKVGGLRQRQIIDQREKLLALGQLSAGLTHQLNNPAAAAARAVSDLREKIAGMRHKLAMLADGKFSPEGLRVLVTIQEEVAEQVAKSKALELTALEASDREDAIGDWLEDHGIVGGVGLRADLRRGGPGHRLAGAHLRLGRRGRRDRVAAGRDRLAAVHHRHRADDEPDRRGQQPHLGTAGRRQAVLADGPRAVSERQRPRAPAQHHHDVRREAGQGQAGRSWSRNSTSRFPKSSATQAISTRCGPTSSTTRSRRWAATAR